MTKLASFMMVFAGTFLLGCGGDTLEPGTDIPGKLHGAFFYAG